MKNTNLETLGNNYPSNKIKRIQIPLFTQENPDIIPGLKYFFPENPEIDRYNIVGIEAHLLTTPALAIGDIKDAITQQLPQYAARDLYLCIYDSNNEEIFYNLPVRSLFTYMPFAVNNNITKRIKPFSCKIKTRSCYVYQPANVPTNAPDNTYLSLTFFYN